MQCVECESDSVKSLGARFHGKEKFMKYVCDDCGQDMLVPLDSAVSDEDDDFPIFPATERNIASAKRIVVTSATNNSKVNQIFLSALERYCSEMDAVLVVIPIRYRNNDGDPTIFDDKILDYVVDHTIKLDHSAMKIMGSIKISPTADNPLSGMDPISKGSSIVIGHPQVSLKTMPQHNNGYPPIITTTGSITEPNYIQSKAGIKAEFNHCYSAVLIEQDAGTFFIRHLNFDGVGFADLGDYFTPEGISEIDTAAIITGDEHAVFSDYDVASATYLDDKSLVKTLKPSVIVRHDILDCFSVSHHHKKNTFTRYAKWKSGYNSIEAELNETLAYLVATSPENTENWIISSNHNEHLLRWLNECDPKIEPWNAIIYHELMYKMLKQTNMGDNGAEYPDPFELYCDGKLTENFRFMGRRDSTQIFDIEVGYHGDQGTNGARGSRAQFSILPTKTVVGHSHSPGITKGCYQVGTSSTLAMEYNVGPSSWHHAHCIVYGNGKRQLVFIVDGKYRI